MQYLTRAILASLVPRSMGQSRRVRVALVLIVVAAAAVLTGILVHRRVSSDRPVQKELGLKPVRASGENGNTWTVEPAPAQPFARLQETQVQLGPPFTVRTKVQRQNAREVTIELIIEGRAGERYLSGIRKNGVRVPAPAFTLVNEAGKVIHKDQFSYG